MKTSPVSLFSGLLAMAVVVPAMLILPAGAQMPPPHGDRAFGLLEFDANGDGRLTSAELSSGNAARFAAIDANKDGSASREEMKAAMQARREEAKKAHFAAMDADKNGELSAAELEAGRPAGRHDGKGPEGRRGPGKGPGGGRMGKLDADDNGLVSQAEFSKRFNDAFAAADADKDGIVTVTELQALSPRP